MCALVSSCQPADRVTEFCYTSGFKVSGGLVITHGASVAYGSLDNASVGPTMVLLRLVWPASRLTRTPLARRRWQRSIRQRDVTI